MTRYHIVFGIMLSLGLVTQTKVKAETLSVSLTANPSVATPNTWLTASGVLTLSSPQSKAGSTSAWLLFPGGSIYIPYATFANNCFPQFGYQGNIVGNYSATLLVSFENPQGQQGSIGGTASLYLPGPSSTPPTNPTPPTPPM